MGSRQRRMVQSMLHGQVMPPPAAPQKSQKKSTAQPRPVLHVPPRGIGPILEPHHNDVLCGRGGRINAHEGNVRFRDIIQAHKKEYLAKSTKKLEKAHIASRIITKIRTLQPPGRFLKEDPRDHMWYDIGDAKAIKKAGQALREDAPDLRQEMDDDDDDDNEDLTNEENGNRVKKSKKKSTTASTATKQKSSSTSQHSNGGDISSSKSSSKKSSESRTKSPTTTSSSSAKSPPKAPVAQQYLKPNFHPISEQRSKDHEQTQEKMLEESQKQLLEAQRQLRRLEQLQQQQQQQQNMRLPASYGPQHHNNSIQQQKEALYAAGGGGMGGLIRGIGRNRMSQQAMETMASQGSNRHLQPFDDGTGAEEAFGRNFTPTIMGSNNMSEISGLSGTTMTNNNNNNGGNQNNHTMTTGSAISGSSGFSRGSSGWGPMSGRPQRGGGGAASIMSGISTTSTNQQPGIVSDLTSQFMFSSGLARSPSFGDLSSVGDGDAGMNNASIMALMANLPPEQQQQLQQQFQQQNLAMANTMNPNQVFSGNNHNLLQQQQLLASARMPSARSLRSKGTYCDNMSVASYRSKGSLKSAMSGFSGIFSTKSQQQQQNGQQPRPVVSAEGDALWDNHSLLSDATDSMVALDLAM